MNLKKIAIVLTREFVIRVRKKSFIIMTILAPVLFAVLMLVPSLIMLYGGGSDEEKVVMIIDGSKIAETYFENDDEYTYKIEKDLKVDYIKENLDSLGVYALVEISPLDSVQNLVATSYSRKQINMDLKTSISRYISSALEDYKLTQYNIENLEEIMDDIKSRVPLTTITLGKDGEEKVGKVEIFMAISYIACFLIYMFIFMFGSMVMRSVLDEKSSRIVEVIVSSVKPFELMMGKILGVAAVALTQLFIWIILFLTITTVTQSIIGMDGIMDTVAAQQEGALDAIGMDSEVIMNDIQAKLLANPEVNEVLNAISGINFSFIIISFLIYFVLGYLLYSALFAAVGGAVDNEADSQQFLMPVTIPLIIGLFLMIHTFQYPDSSLSFWASIIPFTSPMVMMARVPFDVPMWEYLLSIGLLIVTFIGVTYISAKIYRVGILMYGKKISWKDLWKWLRY